jgi:hypothetical protein
LTDREEEELELLLEPAFEAYFEAEEKIRKVFQDLPEETLRLISERFREGSSIGHMISAAADSAIAFRAARMYFDAHPGAGPTSYPEIFAWMARKDEA